MPASDSVAIGGRSHWHLADLPGNEKCHLDLGQYQSIASVEIMQGTTPGQVRFSCGFKEDGVQIEGVLPEAMG